MWSIFVTSVNAIFPIILLILLGYLLKRFWFLNQNFIKVGNKFIFRVCLPCMLFINIYDSMDSFADIRWDVVIYSVIAICAIFGLGLLTAVLTTKKKNRRGVILQCSFRSNFAIIGLTLVERLGGDTAIAGIVSAFSIPVFNVLAVVALFVFNGEETDVLQPAELEGVQYNLLPPVQTFRTKHGLKAIVLNIVKNPLIIGVVIGLLFVGVREVERAAGFVNVVEVDGQFVEVAAFRFSEQLKFLYTAVKDLKAIASPLALIVLGGQFEFSAVKGMTKEIIVGVVLRIIIAPILGIGVAFLLSNYTEILNIGTEIYPTLIALFGTPVAVSSAIMAGEMKNDEQLATQLVVWTCLGSIFTIFLTVFVLMAGGLLTV